jgi:hypothetical protein
MYKKTCIYIEKMPIKKKTIKKIPIRWKKNEDKIEELRLFSPSKKREERYKANHDILNYYLSN